MGGTLTISTFLFLLLRHWHFVCCILPSSASPVVDCVAGFGVVYSIHKHSRFE